MMLLIVAIELSLGLYYLPLIKEEKMGVERKEEGGLMRVTVRYVGVGHWSGRPGRQGCLRWFKESPKYH